MKMEKAEKICIGARQRGCNIHAYFAMSGGEIVK